MDEPRRHHFTYLQRRERLAAWGWVCWLCGNRIDTFHGEDFEIHHITEWELTHDDRIKNTPPVHVECHRKWTAEHSVPMIAKANAVRSKHEAHLKRMALKLVGGGDEDCPSTTKRGTHKLGSRQMKRSAVNGPRR